MIYYIFKRILRGILTFFVAISLTFLIIRLLPSDPVSVMVDSRMTQADIDALNEEFGLDQSLLQQYRSYIVNIFRGELGSSFSSRQPVSLLLAERFPWTFLLIFSVLCCALVLGFPLGVTAARHANAWQDKLINVFAVLGTSIFVPSLGICLLYLLGVKFPILPIGGTHTPGLRGVEYFISVVQHMVLPVLTLLMVTLANYVLHIRASMIDLMDMDYMRTARSKGMSENRVLWKHGVRNALIPTVNITGLLLGSLSAGSILTETVFSYPGLGRLIYDAVGRLDYPVLQGAFLALAAIVIVLGILSDILYVKLDPRVKLQ